MSPGFTPRPSLSGLRVCRSCSGERRVSPGFTPRPSLSALRTVYPSSVLASVAGVHASAFVERGQPRPRPRRQPGGVAGVHASAFVERRRATRRSSRRTTVSPGFTPRPSLSAPQDEPEGAAGSRVAGVHASAFVERRPGTPPSHETIDVSPGFTPRPSLSADQRGVRLAVRDACRRGSRLGLR